MAGRQGGTGGNRQSGDTGEATIQVQTTVKRELTIEGVTYEETTDNGEPVIKVSAGGKDARNLSDEEIGAISRFFVGHQRRSARGGGAGVNDGRGQVTDPSHDARLKGNESQRPTDPDRSKQSGRASATGNGNAS